jgi:hypothetical protein
MVAKDGGRRLFVTARRMPKFFEELESMLKDFRSKPAKLHYWLEKEIPGLEILFADDNFDAATVWKSGNDLRIAVTDNVAAGKAEKLIREEAERLNEDEAETEEMQEARSARQQEFEAKHRYDGIGWLGLNPDGSTNPIAQPDAVQFIVLPDGKDVAPMVGAWKSRSGDIEVRIDEKGLYKLTRGALTKLSAGDYAFPAISANGRWVLAAQYGKGDAGLVRINLQTGRSFPIKDERVGEMAPVAFVPSINKFLVGIPTEESYGNDSIAFSSNEFLLIDPETGAVSDAKGDMGPISQQTFRPLQPTGRPFEFWAAVADEEKNVTRVGVYDARAFIFRPVLTIPKISFSSMEMWVDGGGKKVYFTYNGHLLAIPLETTAKPS